MGFPRSHDRTVALNRLQSAGAILTTTESALFDIMKSADHPKFKAISSLVKRHNEAIYEFKDDDTL